MLLFRGDNTGPAVQARANAFLLADYPTTLQAVVNQRVLGGKALAEAAPRLKICSKLPGGSVHEGDKLLLLTGRRGVVGHLARVKGG